jgi:hypothetical protein
VNLIRSVLTIHSAAQAVSATTTPVSDTSPLSELPRTPSLEVSSARRSNNGRVEVHVSGDLEESAGEHSEDELPYGCQYCSKTYVSEEKLKVRFRNPRFILFC